MFKFCCIFGNLYANFMTKSILLFVLLSRVYIWMRTTNAEARRGRMYSTSVYCLAFTEASNRPCINILNANSLWSSNSRWIPFGCLSNVYCISKCCLPRLGRSLRFHMPHLPSRLFTFRCKSFDNIKNPFSIQNRLKF